MASHPWQKHNRLLFSVFACVLNYRQVKGFVKVNNRPLRKSDLRTEGG
jgi:hypothetical protein